MCKLVMEQCVKIEWKQTLKTVYKIEEDEIGILGFLWFLVLREWEENTCVILLNELEWLFTTAMKYLYTKWCNKNWNKLLTNS